MYGLLYLLLTRARHAAINARRRDRTWRYLMWSALAGVIAGVLLSFAAAFVLLLISVKMWWFAAIMFAVLVVPIIAGFATRHIFVRGGWTRLAYWGGIASRPGADSPAYGLCAAAWAFAQRPTPSGEAWLAAKRDSRLPMGDAEVVATALIAAGRGDADTCRALLRSVDLLVESHPAVREVVGEWLAVDAAERGAWSEIADAAAETRWPASPLTYFLEGVALVHQVAPNAPRAAELRARWLLAPYRRATAPLLAGERAPAPAPIPTEPEGASGPGDQATPVERRVLPRAVAAHLAFGARTPTATSLDETVRAWDAALADGGTHSWLARRALELDAPIGSVDRALREVADAIIAELARVAEAARLGAPGSHGPVGDQLARRLRHGRLDALETGFTRWSQRRTDGERRAGIDEWREFIALRAAYDAAVAAGGLELRRLAFPHAFSTGSNMAAWLWNHRNEYALSHAISKWLLGEALAVGDTEAIELGHRNCSLAVPTRTGDGK